MSGSLPGCRSSSAPISVDTWSTRFTRGQWFSLPLSLAHAVVQETDYSREEPSAELVEAVKAALAAKEPAGQVCGTRGPPKGAKTHPRPSLATPRLVRCRSRWVPEARAPGEPPARPSDSAGGYLAELEARID